MSCRAGLSMSSNGSSPVSAASMVTAGKKRRRLSKREKKRKKKKRQRKLATRCAKAKKKRQVPNQEDRDLRKELAARLLSKVDRHLRGNFPKKYYLKDGRTLDEEQLELIANPVICSTLGNGSARTAANEEKCFEMCKSIVKQRRAYVKKNPGTPIKQVIVISGSDSDSDSDSQTRDSDNQCATVKVRKLFDRDSQSTEESKEEAVEADVSQNETATEAAATEDAVTEAAATEPKDSSTDDSDSDYHNAKVEKKASELPIKKRCQGKDCTLLLPLDECFPEVGII